MNLEVCGAVSNHVPNQPKYVAVPIDTLRCLGLQTAWVLMMFWERNTWDANRCFLDGPLLDGSDLAVKQPIWSVSWFNIINP